MTKTTRIKESSAYAYTASLWQISDYFYTLQWDHWDESLTYCKEDVEDNFAKRIWTKLEDSLPRTFKFRLKNNPPPSDQEIYTYHQHLGGFTSVFRKEPYYVDEDHARESVANGNWIVMPSEPEENFIDTLQIKIALDGLDEAMKGLKELSKQSNTLLESIKDFTSGTGHDVFISEGIYKVYRKDEDSPYICHTDEQVVAVMDALITLDEAGKEGEGRFFTLNLEGIL